jgi:predicted  nucleic acid-binding Zn-ribbon protein
MKQLLIPQLKKLVAIDTTIRSLLEQIEKTTNLIDEYQKTLDGIAERITLLHEEKNQAKKRVNEQELASQTLRDQEIKIRAALEMIQSHKEYALKNKELIHVAEERQLLDDVIIKVWHDLELAEKKLSTELPEYTIKKESIIGEKTTKETELSALTQQLDELEKERIEASAVVPEEWLTKYTRMRLRVDDPIVPISNTHCSACFYGVPRQEITNLKRDHLIICRNCYRFLYQIDEEKAASKPLDAA